MGTIGFPYFLHTVSVTPTLISQCLNLSASPMIPQLLLCLIFIGLKFLLWDHCHITSNDRKFN